MLSTLTRNGRTSYRLLVPMWSSSLERDHINSGHFIDDKNARACPRRSSSSSTASSSSETAKGTVLDSLSSPPVSLEYKGSAVFSAPDDASIFRKALLWLGGYYSKQSTYMRAAKELHTCIKEQALNEQVLEGLQVPNDFQHRHAMLCLHVWMVLKRLRIEGKPGKKISQIMYDDFQDDIEHMVRSAGVQVRLQKHLSELEKQFYGSCTAYDRALGSDPPETLASALYRNVFQAQEDKKQASTLLEQYVKRELACLSKTDSSVVLSGRIRFV